MHLKIFTIPFDDEMRSFDDSELCEFLQGKEVLSFREVYFERGGENYWNILVHWRTKEKTESAGERGGHVDKKDLQKIMEEADMPLFEELRKWRNARAKQAGASAFMIMSNVDLAYIAHRRPSTLQALGEIPGIGEKKTENFGKDILELVKNFSQKKDTHDPGHPKPVSQ